MLESVLPIPVLEDCISGELLYGIFRADSIVTGTLNDHPMDEVPIPESITLVSSPGQASITLSVTHAPTGLYSDSGVDSLQESSLKFLRGKYFAVLANSAQKQIFTDKIFVIKLPATHCSCYEAEISRDKIFAAMLRPAKNFNLENFRLYGSLLKRRGGNAIHCLHRRQCSGLLERRGNGTVYSLHWRQGLTPPS